MTNENTLPARQVDAAPSNPSKKEKSLSKKGKRREDRYYDLLYKPLHELAKIHNDWVYRMGWHNKTVLEYLALIASEVGEAVNECRGERPTHKLGEELADIILRVIDLAEQQGICIASEVAERMIKNEQNGTRGRVI